MAQNSTEVVNLALLRLGEKPIADIAGTENDAQIMNAFYQGAVREVFSNFPWNCAIRRARLTRDDVIENLTGYAYAYELPSDLIRVLDIDGKKNNTYRIEGTHIYTDAGMGTPAECTIRYIRVLDNVPAWDELLEEAVVVKLAEKACIVITQNMNLTAYLQQNYITILTIAQQGASSEDREDITNLLAQLNNAKLVEMLTSKNNYAAG